MREVSLSVVTLTAGRFRHRYKPIADVEGGEFQLVRLRLCTETHMLTQKRAHETMC